MKITYTGPNRSSNYAYAQALYNNKALYAFISGFSRLSPRANLINIDNKLKRHDLFQTLYIGAIKAKLPNLIIRLFNRLSNKRLDNASYKYAVKSDVFLFYRTQGLATSLRLHREHRKTICVMEEVNSHAAYAREILYKEYCRLGLTQPFEEEPDYKLRLQAYEEVDYILCPSEFVRNSFIEKGFKPEKLLKVVFGFPALDVAIPADRYSTDVFRLLYVGQLHYRKGLHYAIAAFAQLRHPNKEFIIVGPKTTLTGLDNIAIPPNVTFTGALKGEQLNEQYRRASCFILPSLEEGLALVQCEALSFGLPLLITTHTGGTDIITDGIEGFIVPPGNASALQEKLQVMADDKELLMHMSQAAVATASKLNSWDMAGAELTAKLQDLIANSVAI